MLRRTLVSVSGLTLCAALIISSLIKPLHAQQVGITFAGLADWDGDDRQDIVARDTTGLLWLYPGERKRGYSGQARVQIGNGWNGITFAGIADWDGDGRQDIVARDNATGKLWLYPGDRTRYYSTQARVEIGNGWNGITFAGLADWDGDGRQDIVARDNATGLLWLYPGERKRGYSTQPRVQIGNGSNGYTFAGLADWDGDGRQDFLAKDNATGLLWLYPGERTRGYSGQPRVQIGNGW
ncbi:MAG: FG-GAP repeat domain-containing protein [Nostoc sp.]